MAYSGLNSFIRALEKENELQRIKAFVDPVLQITEITDRITKNSGKALLFENTGTAFPLLINAFGSDKRVAMAIGRKDLEEVGKEIDEMLSRVTDTRNSWMKKMSAVPSLIKMAGILPVRLNRKGKCQQIIHSDPDLSILPVLKCWPYDAGRFVTLPLVHTKHPQTGSTNLGMYRMQILDKNTTGMHWQRHKTGANHFEEWKKAGKRMPVSVALGGDPVYTYAATAPLPENVDEYILAGFLRKKKVKMVRCITNDLFVPDDADIIIEGFVDTAKDLVWEGPFGDHTGFYSLADWYPRFHITCITHSANAVYPATIVGVPPQEDAWIAKATEKIFLSPVRLSLSPEVIDFHLPEAGIAHNLLIVKIIKSYPGQGMKVINSLSGAGQMMFTKCMVVVSGDVEIRNYKELIKHILSNTDPENDLMFSRGPLDVLDHSSDTFSFGGKAGVDATVKLPEELTQKSVNIEILQPDSKIIEFLKSSDITNYNTALLKENIPVLILSVDCSKDNESVGRIKDGLKTMNAGGYFKIILMVDHTVNPLDYYVTTWQVLGNSDPQRDHDYLAGSLFIDGTIKAFRKGGFPRKWPNVVCSDDETISLTDQIWDSLGIGKLLPSPSLKIKKLVRDGNDEIIVSS